MQLAHNELHPIERIDYLFAMLASVMANSWRSEKVKEYKINDFLLPWGQTDEDRARHEAIKARAFVLSGMVNKKPPK